MATRNPCACRHDEVPCWIGDTFGNSTLVSIDAVQREMTRLG